MKSTGKIWILFDSVTQKQTKPLSTLQAQVTLLNIKNKEAPRYFLWTPGWTEWIPLKRFLESDQTYFVFGPPGNVAPPALIDDEKTMKSGVGRDDDITQVSHRDPSSESGLFTEILISDIPEVRADYGYYHEDFNAESIDPESEHRMRIRLPEKQKTPLSASDRRTDERHHFKIEVILINKKGRAFRTHSKNISLGGTLLEEDLPKEFLNTSFDLIIVNKFERDQSRGRLHFQGRIVGDYKDPRRLMFMDSDQHTLKRLEVMLKAYVEHQRKLRKKPQAG